MSGEEQNRSFYKETFEEIPVPEGMAEKVGRITESAGEFRGTSAGSVMRKMAIAASVLMVLFVGSNGIACATTGETWVETMILRRNIEGVDYEIEAEKRELRNGETLYFAELELEDGRLCHVVEYDGEGEYMVVPDTGVEVWREDGRTYIWDGDREIDVTADLEDDGFAIGTYKEDGVLKGYKFWKKDGFISCRMEILCDEANEWYKENEWYQDSLRQQWMMQ